MQQFAPRPQRSDTELLAESSEGLGHDVHIVMYTDSHPDKSTRTHHTRSKFALGVKARSISLLPSSHPRTRISLLPPRRAKLGRLLLRDGPPTSANTAVGVLHVFDLASVPFLDAVRLQALVEFDADCARETAGVHSADDHGLGALSRPRGARSM